MQVNCELANELASNANENSLALNRVEGGELFERVLNEDFELSERACSIFMRQITMACEYIHSRNVVHLDLKVPALFSFIRLEARVL